MPTVQKSILINAPAGRVFATHDDARRVPEYMPGIVRVADVVRTGRRIGDSQRLTYSVLGLRFPTKMTIQEWEKDRRMVVKLEGGLNGTFTATYESQGGGTQVTWRIDYTLKPRILDKAVNLPLAEGMSEKNVQRGLENLKMICEAG